MAKHTPGPWAVVGTNIEQIEEGVEIATVSEYRTMTPRQAANARLIAAAPELLAALEALNAAVIRAGHGNTAMPELSQAWAAIHRATGQ